MRFKIKQMIDAEAPDAILSDDAIVEKLKAQQIDIARRTVAKYRESLRIPSSVERRREKQATPQPLARRRQGFGLWRQFAPDRAAEKRY